MMQKKVKFYESDDFPQQCPDLGGNFSYQTHAFSNFTISVGQRDGYCLTSGGSLVSVVGFGKEQGVHGIFGKIYLDPQPFFVSPINSFDVGVKVVT